MKKYIFLIIAAIAAACGSGTPKGILSEQEMAAILIDMHIAEAKIGQAGVSGDSAKLVNQIALRETLDKHGVEKDVYLNSYDYYLANLSRFEKIYSIVVDSLSLKERLNAGSEM